jgi:hypothetical protein
LKGIIALPGADFRVKDTCYLQLNKQLKQCDILNLAVSE